MLTITWKQKQHEIKWSEYTSIYLK